MKPGRVERDFRQLLDAIEGLHHRIEDLFFSHQQVFAREATLFDPAE
jgi:hypothetical protein